jgi:hypothetical protein
MNSLSRQANEMAASLTQMQKESGKDKERELEPPAKEKRGLKRAGSTPKTVILPFFQNSPMQVKLNIMTASLLASVETGFYCSNIPSILVSTRLASAIPKWFEHHGIHLEWSRFVLMKTPVPGDDDFRYSDNEDPNLVIKLKSKNETKSKKAKQKQKKYRNYDEYSFPDRYKERKVVPAPTVEHRTKVKLLVSTNAIPFTCQETSVTFPLHVVQYHPNYERFDVGVNLLSFQAIFSLRILSDYVQVQEMEQKIIQLEQKLYRVPCCTVM